MGTIDRESRQEKARIEDDARAFRSLIREMSREDYATFLRRLLSSGEMTP